MDRRYSKDSLAVVAALVTATMMIAHQVAGKATRDGLFLTYFDVVDLPKMVIAAAAASLVTVLFMSAMLARFGPARTIPVAFLFSASLFLLEWAVVQQAPRTIALILYLHMAMFGAVLISGFWSTINERFDPHSAKRNVARVAAAATLGGVIGGLLAQRVSTMVGVNAMLLVLMALHAGCGIGVLLIAGFRADPPDSTRLGEQDEDGPGAEADRMDQQMRSGFPIIASSSYLRYMGLLVMTMAAVAGLLDWALKSEAKDHFKSSEDLVAFFGSFYAVTGLVGFALQSTLGPRLLNRFGIGTTIAVPPGAILATGGIALAFGSLWTLALARGTQMMLATSLFRSAFELLYTPVPREQKRPTKTIIDVAADRIGDVIGSGVIIVLLALVTDLPSGAAVALAMLGALAAIFLVRRLHHGYVEQLASNLRKGAVSLDAGEVIDATTQHILAETSTLTEREQLMSRIKELRKVRESQQSGAVPTDDSPDLDTLDGDPEATLDLSPEELEELQRQTPGLLRRYGDGRRTLSKLVQTAADLDSGHTPKIRKTLHGDFMDVRLVPLLIPLLGNEEVAVDARMELRWLVPQVTGQLVDALLDPDVPLTVRQRLPGVLEVSYNPRVVEGLLHGLEDPEFNIRYSCARTLARMRRRDPALKIPDMPVYAAVSRELDASQEEWEGRRLTIDAVMPVDTTATSEPTNPDHALELVFAMLALTLEPDAVRLAKAAAFSRDANLRGTALEYLENVVPDNIRVGLWPHLGQPETQPRGGRSARELLREMRRAIEP